MDSACRAPQPKGVERPGLLTLVILALDPLPGTLVLVLNRPDAETHVSAGSTRFAQVATWVKRVQPR
jgi:hypothetical protein